MNNIDINTLKKPYAWAIIIPALLFVWAVGSTVTMAGNQKNTNRRLENTEKALNIAEDISNITRKARGRNSAEAMVQKFTFVDSTLKCAKAAGIPKSKVKHINTPRPKHQKKGAAQRSEKCKLNAVLMLQIASFIDYAEQNFSSVHCSQLSISPSPDKKNKDSWDATINFVYSTK